MTAEPLPSAAKAPVSANNGTGEGGLLVYARASAGQIYLLRCGRMEPVTRWEAVGALSECDGSPFPSSQERARQIRAALKETTQ